MNTPICHLRHALTLTLAVGALMLAAQGCAAAEAVCPPTAQAPTAEQAQAEMRAARDRGFLWRIARDGRVSYLYGTVHIARVSWMFPGPQLAKALAASDTVALELDMLDADIQRRLAAGMLAGPDDQVPPALAARLHAQMLAACVDADAFAKLAPIVQLAALTTLAARWDGLDPAYAIDSFLAAFARGAGKPVVSLESPELQIAVLKGDPQTEQQTMAHDLEQLERGQTRPQLVRIAQVWAEGRADELARYEEWCDCVDTAADRADLKRLLDDRNPALADSIAALHATGQRVFAAVGALHMIGPLGLPALLAQQGFTVERIDLTR